jgi:glycine betaine/choline ABC-type transport system substrate-binding protein
MYPEYTGTALQRFLQNASGDRQEVYQRVK